jgi:hypothetical protein
VVTFDRERKCVVTPLELPQHPEDWREQGEVERCDWKLCEVH